MRVNVYERERWGVVGLCFGGEDRKRRETGGGLEISGVETRLWHLVARVCPRAGPVLLHLFSPDTVINICIT